MFEGLLISIVDAPNHTKCILLSNQKCMIQPSLPSLINLHPIEYSQEFYYYPFVFKLDRCIGSCNTLNDLSNKVCVSNKTDDFNLSMLSMITGVTKHSIALTKHISYKCIWKFDGRKYKSDHWRKNDKCQCECKKLHVCGKDYTWNPAKRSFQIGKYLASIMDDAVITCDEMIDAEVKLNNEETKTFPTVFNEKK